jgi:hypothetical protein
LFLSIGRLIITNLEKDVLTEIISNKGHNKGELTPYLMFKYVIKTEITRKYYERRLKKFFDFIE